MKVLELLKKAGSKTGLLHIEEQVQTFEIKIVERRIISLKELQSESEHTDLTKSPPELTVSFDRVFEAMNLPAPEHGFTIERICEMLDSQEIKSKPRKEAAEAILVALGQNQVKPEDIVKDAVARDKALDSYEDFVDKKILDRAKQRKSAAADLKHKIQEHEEQIHKLETAQARDEASFPRMAETEDRERRRPRTRRFPVFGKSWNLRGRQE